MLYNILYGLSLIAWSLSFYHSILCLIKKRRLDLTPLSFTISILLNIGLCITYICLKNPFCILFHIWLIIFESYIHASKLELLNKKNLKDIDISLNDNEKIKEFDNLEELDKQLINSVFSTTIVIYGTEYCHSCLKLKNDIKYLIKTKPNVEFIYFNIKEADEIVNRFKVNSVPIVVVYNKGLEKDIIHGNIDLDQIDLILSCIELESTKSIR